MRLESLKTIDYINEDELVKTRKFQLILTEDQEVQNLRGPLTADEFCSVLCLTESKNKNKGKPDERPPITFMYTKNAERSIGAFNSEEITAKLRDFVQFKSANPLQPYGSKDYPFRGDGPLSGYKHAHIGRNAIVVYTFDGKLNRFCIYGVFTHDELGIGNPANQNKMRSMRNSFDKQGC